MKIALIGFGRMGQAVEKIALDRGHAIAYIAHTYDDLGSFCSNKIDIAIEFSQGDQAYRNLEFLIHQGISVVSGTTGMQEDINELRSLVETSDSSFLWSSNFATGVNIFFRLVGYAARIMNSFGEFDVYGHEIHHKGKKDAPSGTACHISNILVQNLERKKVPVFSELQRVIEPHELHMSSSRGGFCPGDHMIRFESELETIEMRHRAHNRECFALGAVQVAEWLKDKKGFYTMNDYIDDLLHNNQLHE